MFLKLRLPETVCLERSTPSASACGKRVIICALVFVLVVATARTFTMYLFWNYLTRSQTFSGFFLSRPHHFLQHFHIYFVLRSTWYVFIPGNVTPQASSISIASRVDAARHRFPRQ
ncbi:unnamed protein product [Pylaiella littoralis]